MADALVINQRVRIPLAELRFRASRAGGPGGQHVNTSSTRVELSWDIAHSPSLNDEDRQRLLTRLATRIDSEGTLRLVASASRSQYRNRVDVTERLRELVSSALVIRKTRKKTRPTQASRERRLQEKQRRGELKRSRRPPRDE